MIPFWLLAADILGLTLPYLIVNRINDARDRAAFDPELALDRSLPFVDWAILAYGSFYLYYVLAAVIARSSDAGARRLIVMHQTLMMLTWGILVVMLLLPVEVDLRDQVDPRPIFQPFFDALYSADSAWNAWPSLHIVHALLIVLTADLSLRARHRRPSHRDLGLLDRTRVLCDAGQTALCVRCPDGRPRRCRCMEMVAPSCAWDVGRGSGHPPDPHLMRRRG